MPERPLLVFGAVNGHPQKPGFDVGLVGIVPVPGAVFEKRILNRVIGILPGSRDTECRLKHPVAEEAERFLRWQFHKNLLRM